MPQGKSRFSRTPAKTGRARQLRRSMTEAEKRLWWRVKSQQIADYSFRRQHPVGPYVLDFYCPALKLAIELDGGQHGEDHIRVRDERRTAYLRSRGIDTVRFWNNEIFENIDGVLETILDLVESLQRLNE